MVGVTVILLSLQRPLHLQVWPHSLLKALSPSGTRSHIYLIQHLLGQRGLEVTLQAFSGQDSTPGA